MGTDNDGAKSVNINSVLLLKPHFHRCHILAISISNNELAKCIFPLIGDFSSLQSLVLQLYYNMKHSLFLNPPDMMLLEDICARVRGKALPELLDVVVHCHALRFLSISPLDRNFNIPAAADKPSFPNLEILHVHGYILMKLVSSWDLSHLLHLTLDEDMDGFYHNLVSPPNLQTLELHGHYPGHEEQPVLDFISNAL